MFEPKLPGRVHDADLAICGDPESLRSKFIHGIERMPCTFTPGGAH